MTGVITSIKICWIKEEAEWINRYCLGEKYQGSLKSTRRLSVYVPSAVLPFFIPSGRYTNYSFKNCCFTALPQVLQAHLLVSCVVMVASFLSCINGMIPLSGAVVIMN